MSEKCDSDAGCSGCSSAAGCSTNEKQSHTKSKIENTLSNIKFKIMVMSGKGGVGKSTFAVNLAAMLAGMGYRVGLIDADIHGPNVPKMLGIKEKGVLSSAEGIIPYEPIDNLFVMSVGFLIKEDDDAIIWRSPLKHSIIEQFLSDVNWGELDFLLFDLPPGTGDEPLSVSHLIGKVDGSVIVTTPQEVALLDSRKSVTFSKKLNIPVLGIVENMSGFVCPKCGEKTDIFKTGGGEKAAGELNVNFLGKIPLEPELVMQGDLGRPFVIDKPNSESAKSFKNIAKNILGQTILK